MAADVQVVTIGVPGPPGPAGPAGGAAGTPPAVVSAEIGAVAPNVLAVVFSEHVKAPDYAAGVTVTVDAAPAGVVAAARQADRVAVHFTIANPPVLSTSAVRFRYLEDDGFVTAADGTALADVDVAVTNNVAAGPASPTALTAAAGSVVTLNWTGVAWPPLNLTATATGSVVLNWTEAVSYNVYRRTGSGPRTQIATGVAPTTYTDSTVAANVTYTYDVTAVAAGVESAPSNAVTVTPTVAALTPQATRLNWSRQFSDGSAQSATYRQFHTSQAGFTTLRLLYINGGNAFGDSPNAITVRASVETGNIAGDYAGAATPCTRVTFGGATSKTLAPEEFVISDPVTVTVGAGGLFCTRTYVSVAALGQVWPISDPRVADYDAVTYHIPSGYDAGVDKTGGGATTSGITGGLRACAPLAILGAGNVKQPVVAIVGDSIPYGDIEGAPYADPYGWADRAFGPARSAIGCLKLCVPAQTVNLWTTNYLGVPALAVMAAVQASAAICTLGVNDLAHSTPSLATMKSYLSGIWAACRTAGVKKVYQTTLTPYTSSTDGFATTTNQTKLLGAGEAVRTGLNDWIRTTPTGLDGFFDMADVCESARNSGLWTIAYGPGTVDGLHPTGPTLHQPMALIVDPTIFPT